jgi:ribosome biogenesis GTPase
MASQAAWGWDERWHDEYERMRTLGEPARVVSQERDRWLVRTDTGEAAARIPSGNQSGILPVVGDWALVAPGPEPADPLSIRALLPRRSAFVRGAAGGSGQEQVLAANVDLVWITHGLDTPLNLRRLERYLAVAWESGAVPSILLTKADLADDLDEALAQVRKIAFGVPVHPVSAQDASSVASIRTSIPAGQTVVLLGPSGAGKSTLVNLLVQADVASTAAVRPGDRKGRHTTTRRHLFQVLGGGLVIDTPGLRELRIGELDRGLDQAYPEIEELAGRCRFADCRHRSEPGCAVLEAVEANELTTERLESYRKLQDEADYARRRADRRAQKKAISEHKTALKTMRFHPKRQDRGRE